MDASEMRSHKDPRRFLSCARLLIALLALLSLLSPSMVKWCSAKEIRLTSLAWLTTQGRLYEGDDMMTSHMIIPIAVKHFNTRNGSIVPVLGTLQGCNSTIRLVDGIQDTQNEPQVATEILLDAFNNHGIDVIHGPTTSSAAQLVAVAAGALGIPMISHTTTAETLSDKTVFPTMHRVVHSDGQFAEVIADVFAHFGFQRIGMIASNDAFGEGLRSVLSSACQARRTAMRSYLYDPAVSEEDLLRSVRKGLLGFIEEKVSIIFYTGLSSAIDKALAIVANELNWIEGKLYVGHRNVPIELLDHTPPGELKTIVQRFFAGSLIVARSYDTESRNWAKLEEAWGSFSVSDVNPYLPERILADGVTTLKLPENYFRNGVAAVSKRRHYANAYDAIVAVGLAACGPRVSLMENLRNVDFEGVTGRVRFDTKLNRDFSTISYSLTNLVRDLDDTRTGVRSVRVADFINAAWRFTTPIIFSDGTSNTPSDMVVPVNAVDAIPLGAKVFGWIESSIGILLSFWAFIHVVRNRTQIEFINAQPVFLLIMLFGCMLMSASIAALAVETNEGCMGFPWLLTSGLTLVLSSLIAKSSRVAILWYGHSSAGKRHVLSRIETSLSIIAAAVLLQVAIMLSWQLIAPLHIQMVTVQANEEGYPLSSALTCLPSIGDTAPFLGAMGALLVLMMIITVAVTFWVRNAPEKFHDARNAAAAGLVLFQLFFVGVPTAVVVWATALARFLVVSSVVFMLVITVLVTLFFPKVFGWKFSALNPIPLRSRITAAETASPHNGAELLRDGEGGMSSPLLSMSVVEIIDRERRSRLGNNHTRSTASGMVPFSEGSTRQPTTTGTGYYMNERHRTTSNPGRAMYNSASNPNGELSSSFRDDPSGRIEREGTPLRPSSGVLAVEVVENPMQSSSGRVLAVDQNPGSSSGRESNGPEESFPECKTTPLRTKTSSTSLSNPLALRATKKAPPAFFFESIQNQGQQSITANDGMVPAMGSNVILHPPTVWNNLTSLPIHLPSNFSVPVALHASAIIHEDTPVQTITVPQSASEAILHASNMS